jgi:SAM-dependent methyltransferase
VALPPLIRTPFGQHPPDTDLAFQRWLDSPQGRALLHAERQVLGEVLPRVPGQRAVQLGLGQQPDLLASCRLADRWRLGRREQAGNAAVGLPAALPLAKRSLDLAVLHHSLDFEDYPHKVLRETVSALQPGGWLVVVGFNPFSLWGLTRLFRLASGEMPWSARFLRPMRLSDWLNVLSCQVEGLESGYFAPPGRRAARGGFDWLEQLGARLWQQRGAFYVLVARKRAVIMRPLKPSMRQPEQEPGTVAFPVAGRQGSARGRGLE